MITINDLKDLEQHKAQTKVINNEDINNLITYEFKENDKLACVTFNCEIPFGISDLGKLISNGNEKDLLDLNFPSIDCYKFVAKEIYANKKLRIGCLQAEKFIFKDSCQVFEDLQVKDKILGSSLECEFIEITCKEIDCDSLIADNIICSKLHAKILITTHSQFENITAENVNYYNDII